MDFPLRIAICEDLTEDRERLLAVITQSKLSVQIDTYPCGEDFLTEYQLRKYDLIFFDIYMDGMTGIETATEVRKMDTNVAIVFTTTSLDYALESYRLEAMKYIEKPVSDKSILPILQMVQMQKEFAKKLLVKNKNQQYQLPLSDILYLEQSGSKFYVHLVNGDAVMASGKMLAIADQLDPELFYQCHKSYIVNFTFVKSINKDLLLFEMITGDTVHIRRDGFWKTKRAYETFLFGTSKRGEVNG